MNKAGVYALCTILLCALASVPVFATKIKKRDGQIVEGVIKGVIVQRETSKTNEGYFAKYYPLNGKDIDAVDEDGLHLTKGSPSIVYEVGPEKKLPADVEILQMAMTDINGDYPIGVRVNPDTGVTVIHVGGGEFDVKSFFANSINDYTVFKIKRGPDRAISPGQLLSTVRMEKGKMTGINPVLEVNTSQGAVVIPLNQIVDFKGNQATSGQ